MKTGKRVLVVYYSMTGNTERVARDIAARLGADLEKIDDKKNRRGFVGHIGAALDSLRERPAQIADLHRLPDEYALTIVGTPVWAGRMTPAVRAYLRTIHGRVNEVAFFTTSGSTKAEQIVPHMEALAGRKAVAFSGLTGRQLNAADLYEQQIASFVRKVQGDRAGGSSLNRNCALPSPGHLPAH